MASSSEANFMYVRLMVISVVIGMACLRMAFACNCIPEKFCAAPPDVDLRLIDDDQCPTGMVCCGEPASDLDETVCAGGLCVSDQSQCPGEDYDDEEYGAGLIDLRTNDVRCPGTQYCCRTMREQLPACDGTCVPRSLCTMFQPGPAGCAGDNVCCRMDRTAWIDTINDINAMGEPALLPVNDRVSGTCEWSRLGTDTTTVVPPWVVSIWARVDILPGLQADQFVCGGVQVDSSLIMTAASCVKDRPVEEMFANVGDYDISSRTLLRVENIYTVKEKIIHEYYNTSDPVHNDVALLGLTAPVRNGKCTAPLASPPANGCKARNHDCYTIGWNRTLLAAGSGRMKRYPVQVTTFQEDLFCSPGTICIDRDEARCNVEDESLHGSVVICEEGEQQDDWKVRGLLIRNCTGVAIESVVAWLEHQRNPGFVQKLGPADPFRQYLPVRA
ncbi:transmembrane protease serine 7 [Anopheles gambiae]|uniref:transmembrane protease serine 7 n=1 Tax=Anopheles gambiae TaxID=7165 RepID=UPI002AC8C3F7|nr:transmembrane protease serine 7 [Anopheles gambiae]